MPLIKARPCLEVRWCRKKPEMDCLAHLELYMSGLGKPSRTCQIGSPMFCRRRLAVGLERKFPGVGASYYLIGGCLST